MNKTNINYPHPVLSSANEDYINSSFELVINGDPCVEGDDVVIDISYELICDGLQNYISARKAQVVVYLDSSVSEYRKMQAFPFDNNQMKIRINKNDINRMLTVKGYILAAEPTTMFPLPEHNKKIFGAFPFNLRKGDILGLATHFYNIPLDSYDPLVDRPSIFAIRKQNERPKEEVSADYSGGKITIWLNEDTHNKFEKLYSAPETRGFLSSFFATPVLVDVLHYIKNMSEEDRSLCENKKWYQVISHRLKELKIDLLAEESMTKVANLVLPHVFPSSIEAMTNVFTATVLKGGERNEA